ncbi:MAG: DUF6445 family protein [Mangrovicoccus sp.]
MNPFALNPSMRAYVDWIGEKEVPLFRIDDIYIDPDAVRDFAFQMEFPNSQAYYPGRHQPLSEDIEGIPEFLAHIGALFGQAVNQTVPPGGIGTDFSIVTTPEYKLLGQQGQPHIDGVPMLGVIYLNDADFGGTIFFRNKETGSVKVLTPQEKEHYDRVTSGQQNGERQNTYITDSDSDWEAIHTTDGTKNCLVMWPGTVWHSINVKIPPETGEISDKRLTQRVIINKVAPNR